MRSVGCAYEECKLLELLRRRWLTLALAYVIATCVGQVIIGGADLVRFGPSESRMYRYDDRVPPFSRQQLLDYLTRWTYGGAVAVIVIAAIVLCRGSALQRWLALSTVAAGGVAALFKPYQIRSIGPVSENGFTIASYVGDAGWCIREGEFRCGPIVVATTLLIGLAVFNSRAARGFEVDGQNRVRQAAMLLWLGFGWAALIRLVRLEFVLATSAEEWFLQELNGQVTSSRGAGLWSRVDAMATPYVGQVVGVLLIGVVALALTTTATTWTKPRLAWLAFAALCPLLMKPFGAVGLRFGEGQVPEWRNLDGQVIGADTYNAMFSYGELFRLFALCIGFLTPTVLVGLSIRLSIRSSHRARLQEPT